MSRKKNNLKSPPPDHDFTYQENYTGILHFDDKNVLHISYNTSTGELYAFRVDMKTDDVISGTVTLTGGE